ncbi:MAG: PepSY-associated TM helix domain-containing protein [Candidatus Latescibacterota bacterium]|jgi:hypothetical protein|tara:strand:- start:250 stop:846 length:597 start_codon:yes stop_codon:yes gene_type:complete
MYRLIRTIHLYTGLALFFAIALYALSGFVILHGDWFPQGEDKREITLSGYGDAHPADGYSAEQAQTIADALAHEHSLRGRPDKAQHWDNGTWFFSYQRPGTVEEIRIKTDHTTHIIIKKAAFAGFMNRLHHFHGYGDDGRFWLWGLFVDIASAAMIFFAASGIYLWYVLKKDRRLGWIILGGSTAYALGSILFLLFSA